MRNSIFDVSFGSMPGGTMYQEWAIPGTHPDERQPVIKNWHPEDRAAYLGGEYTTTKEVEAA
jgi:hypothetical protein